MGAAEWAGVPVRAKRAGTARWIVCPAPGCGRRKFTKHETCSRACGVRLVKLRRGADFYTEAGLKAGRGAAARGAARRAEIWAQRFPGVDPALCSQIWDGGYRGGYRAGRIKERRLIRTALRSGKHTIADIMRMLSRWDFGQEG